MKTLLCALACFSSAASFAQGDSLFVDSVKRFAAMEFGVTWSGFYYTEWLPDADGPYGYLYVSDSAAVRAPAGFSGSFIFTGSDEAYSARAAAEYQARGYHTLPYRTFANSATQLSRTLLSYPRSEIVFIVAHELTHNFLIQEKIPLPYQFEEALCDVIGTACAFRFSARYHSLDTTALRTQTTRNEAIYRQVNQYTERISRNPQAVRSLNRSCDSAIHALLHGADSFQKTRFDYPVNNAYLLRNSLYAKHYFLLKAILERADGIAGLLRIIRAAPHEVAACNDYLNACLR